MTITPKNLFRAAGVAAALAGLIFIGVQINHHEMESDHPMHHPFHIHGAGRFLVLSRDGKPESNLVWKDTVLLRAGQTVDILLDVTNAGLWMAHCHIAEHAESGMMFSFDVAPRSQDGSRSEASRPRGSSHHHHHGG
jgi:hypothetical protein